MATAKIKLAPIPYTGIMHGMRQTGRTTRMLIEANNAYKSGYKCIIVNCNTMERDSAKRQYVAMFGKIPRGKVQFILTRKAHDIVDWAAMELEDYLTSKDTKLFVDHAVVETVFGSVVNALHRWDTLDVRQVQQSLDIMSTIVRPGEFTDSEKAVIKDNTAIFKRKPVVNKTKN